MLMVPGICALVEVDGVRCAAEAHCPLPCPQVATLGIALRGCWLALTGVTIPAARFLPGPVLKVLSM